MCCQDCHPLMSAFNVALSLNPCLLPCLHQAPYVQLSALACCILYRRHLWLQAGVLLAQLTLPFPPELLASLHPAATILQGHSAQANVADLLPSRFSSPQFAGFSTVFLILSPSSDIASRAGKCGLSWLVYTCQEQEDVGLLKVKCKAPP